MLRDGVDLTVDWRQHIDEKKRRRMIVINIDSVLCRILWRQNQALT